MYLKCPSAAQLTSPLTTQPSAFDITTVFAATPRGAAGERASDTLLTPCLDVVLLFERVPRRFPAARDEPARSRRRIAGLGWQRGRVRGGVWEAGVSDVA